MGDKMIKAEDKNLDEVTVEELRTRVIELGMSEEDALVFRARKPLISTIKALRGKEDAAEKTFVAPESPKERRLDDAKWQSKADKMREHLEKQPKVRIKIPLDIGGKEEVGVVREVLRNGKKEWEHVSGGAQPVTLNGYTTWVPKGRYWEVPQQVADVIGETDRAAADAGKGLEIDRIDPKTGRPVRDQL